MEESAEPLCATIKGEDREVIVKRKLSFGYGLISSCDCQTKSGERAKFVRRFPRRNDGWMLAQAPALQPIRASAMNQYISVQLFSLLCMTSTTRNAGVVNRTDQSVPLPPLLLIALNMGRQQQPNLIGITLGVKKRRFD